MNKQTILLLLWLVPLILLTVISLVHFTTGHITENDIHIYTAAFLVIAQVMMFDYFTRRKKISS
ncbi:hypothetical protein [Priestia taiwanensis]|uniref:Uncharacterized protein n=1 Tax=Priestia taiwanensis TaxID=1347902 RepID=A0A917AQA9_9BACI|nr:hypothetical protein [Priestia taiwanensis]MBM7362997.1 positive regulator of sigma E activity [Priestia taiwanensis]GGE66800.1 hypothetical protein GCM10007140_16200 [Priestia taiwanensis]